MKGRYGRDREDDTKETVNEAESNVNIYKKREMRVWGEGRESDDDNRRDQAREGERGREREG